MNIIITDIWGDNTSIENKDFDSNFFGPTGGNLL